MSPVRLGPPRMTPQAFSAKWVDNALKESAASKEHFLDVCGLVGSPTPREADGEGEWFAFEKGVEKGAAPTRAGGKKRRGFADVFLLGSFAWEYKGPDKDLDAAYDQLRLYRDALENPPLMIVSDMDRFVVRTNFNDRPVETFSFTNEEIGSDGGGSVALLRAAFVEPYSLRPGRTREAITEEVAKKFGLLAKGLRDRGEDPHRAAHFLMKLVFCLFAEDAGLLPRGLSGELVGAAVEDPEHFPRWARELFGAMASGGRVNYKPIRHFNGGLFADDVALELTREELRVLAEAARLDWGSVEPAVFGTLFERSLDPDKRSQLGAQYTGKEDILRVVEPVLMAPLRREWERVRAEVEADATAEELPRDPGARTRAVNRIQRDAQERLEAFAGKVRSTRVLDPACGSGNFLYVSLSLLLDLEKEVSVFAGRYGRGPFFPEVGPQQLFGIERDPYAHELAQVSVWIGYLQWMHQNGFGSPPDPVLGPMTNVLEMDAVLRSDGDGHAVPEWPEADVVVGNPPFLGGRRIRGVLGDRYFDALKEVYAECVSGSPDLVCYWFERARRLIEEGRLKRAGLIATQAIRNPANRGVLENIKASGDIFMAWSDRPWVLDGADVRVSMVGFDDGSEPEKSLDGRPVAAVSARLTEGVDLAAARRLTENEGSTFQGVVMRGPFDLKPQAARAMLSAGGNPNGRPNSDVVRPRFNARDVTGHPSGTYAVDFGVDTLMEEAALYEAPFAHVAEHVYPARQRVSQASSRERWWLYERPRPEMRAALEGLSRYAVTPRVSKHRLFAWLGADVLPDTRLYVFAREDDYFFGVLHSKAHEVWALRNSPRHGVGNDPTYSNLDCFETFPFPWPLGTEPGDAED
nr:class I SAM-dependent DNA methyltransferase [Rubrobacteraceae bacterium]